MRVVQLTNLYFYCYAYCTFVWENFICEQEEGLTLVFLIDFEDPFSNSIADFHDFLVSGDAESAMFEIGEGFTLGITLDDDDDVVLVSG